MAIKALVVLSGGQDSSTCLAYAMDNPLYDEIHAITFDYGQRHSREIDCAAEMIAAIAKCGRIIPHEIIRIGPILQGSSPLINAAAQVEEYASAEALPGGLEKTFVPMRNALFLMIAANRAVLMGGKGDVVEIYTGVSQEDFGGYPDCRKEFIIAAEEAIQESIDDDSLPRVSIRTPLIFRSKRETVQMAEATGWGRGLNALSHTCYNGMSPPCGKCHACLLRAKGYAEAKVDDPLLERFANIKGTITGRWKSDDDLASNVPRHAEDHANPGIKKGNIGPQF